MAGERRDFQNIREWPLDDVAALANEQIDEWKRQLADIELSRRTTKAQIDAARYMMWSVIAIALTSGLTAFAAVAAWLWPNPLHLH